MKGFVRNVLSLAGGNLTAQVISLLAVPVLTRLYSTDEFGLFSTYLAVVLIIVPISTLRFNSAMLVAETEEQAANLLVLSLGSVLVVSVVVLLCAFPVSASGAGEILQIYLWLIPISVLTQGIVQSLQFRALRAKRFNTVAVAQITESVTDRGTAIGLGLLGGYGALGLVMGRIVGPVINAVVLWFKTSPSSQPASREITCQTLLNTASRYRDFPLFSSWAFLANSAAREMPVLMLAVIYSPAVAGLYGLGLRVLNMPMLMLGDALSKVLLSHTREKKDDRETLGRLQLAAFAVVLYPGMVLMIIMVAVGPGLFATVFGESWRDAGIYAAILSPAIMLMLGYRVMSVLFDLYEQQRQRMFFDFGLLAVRVASLLVAAVAGLSVYEGLAMMMLASSVLYAVAIVYLFRLVHVTLSTIMARLSRSILLMLPSVFGASLIYYVGFDQLQMLAALMVLLALQVAVVVKFDKQLLIGQMQG